MSRRTLQHISVVVLGLIISLVLVSRFVGMQSHTLLLYLLIIMGLAGCIIQGALLQKK